jgi:hypothetical protein
MIFRIRVSFVPSVPNRLSWRRRNQRAVLDIVGIIVSRNFGEPERQHVKYLILIYQNPAAWDVLSEAERREVGRLHLALTDDLTASGELIMSEALDYPSTARHIPLPGDGPYAEAKEYLAGFYLVDCPTIEVAMEHAARVVAYGRVEVRPSIDLRTIINP